MSDWLTEMCNTFTRYLSPVVKDRFVLEINLLLLQRIKSALHL